MEIPHRNLDSQLVIKTSMKIQWACVAIRWSWVHNWALSGDVFLSGLHSPHYPPNLANSKFQYWVCVQPYQTYVILGGTPHYPLVRLAFITPTSTLKQDRTFLWSKQYFTWVHLFLLLTRPVSSRGEGNGNPHQYSCLENSLDRGAQWAIAHGVTKSQTLPKRLSMCLPKIISDASIWATVLYNKLFSMIISNLYNFNYIW